MKGVIPIGLGIVGLVLLFVLLTDGRYFGKRLTYWVYDRAGPAIFGARSEAERWRNLADAAGIRGDEWVLDVGTAVGDLPLSLAAAPDFSGRVVGVDWSPRMMAAAQAEAGRRGVGNGAHFQMVDLREGLPFRTAVFDVVFCLGLLETLPEPEKRLAELRRVLKPEGVMVLSVYRGWSSRSVALSLEWYQTHLGVLGLDAVRVTPCRGNHDALVARATALQNTPAPA